MFQERIRTATELLKTEETYVESLEVIISCYLQPLRQKAEAMSKPPLSKKAVELIFSNIETIFGMNSILLESLRKALSDTERLKPKNQAGLGEALLKTIPFLKMYISYVNNFDTAAKKLSKKIQKNSAGLVAFLKEQRKNERTKGLEIRDLLVMPIRKPKLNLFESDPCGRDSEGRRLCRKESI